MIETKRTSIFFLGLKAKIERLAGPQGQYETEMPNQKPQETFTDNKGVKIIDYSRMTMLLPDPKDKTQLTWQQGDATPSRPPWTTWTGILEARRDSPVGKRILAMDPKAIDGVSASEEDLKKMHKRSDEAKKEWVRGVWTAPEDWKGIEV